MESLEVLIESYLEFQKGLGLSAATVKRSACLLGKFTSWLAGGDVRTVTRETLTSFRDQLQTQKSRFTGKNLSGETIGLIMSSLKGFFDYLALHDKILSNPFEGMRIKQKNPQHLRKVFTEEDINFFLDSIPVTNAYRQRDRALFELMYSSGLRSSDVLSLEAEHVNLEERIILVRGKGKKDAYIPFSETARKFLAAYLAGGRRKLLKRMQKNSREEAKAYVFVTARGRMSYYRLMKRFRAYLEACGLNGKGYTMHSIRHATGTHLLLHGASVRYVQELLRHEDLKTTQVYTQPGVENVKATYRSYHPRENEYFKEIDQKYLAEVRELKARLLWGRQAAEQYRKTGTKKGFGNWKRRDEGKTN